MFKSIAGKISVMAIGLVVCTVLTVSLIQYSRSKDHEVARESERLAFSVNQISVYLRDVAKDARQTALFLASTPPIQGIPRAMGNDGIDPLDGSSTTAWKNRLAQIFKSMTISNEELLQLRLIDASGMELVRVNRRNGRTWRTAEGDLQSKQGAHYVAETLELPAGTAKLFNIDLNREHGQIEEPHIPVMRAATPVYREDDSLFGLVVINVNMNSVLARLAAELPGHRKFLLANHAGDYLSHDDSSKTFGFDLGERFLLQADFPQLASFVDDPAKGHFAGVISLPDGERVVHAAKVPLGEEGQSHDLIALEVTPMKRLLAGIHESRNQVLWLGAVLAMLGALLAMVMSRFLVRPLHALQTAAHDLASGAEVEDLELPLERGDETGALARSFDIMARRLDERQDHLEEKEARISAILNAAVSPIVTIDDRGLIQEVNKATSEMLGYAKDELIGANISLLMTPEDGDQHDRYLENYKTTGVRNVIGNGREVTARRKDGTLVPINLAVSEVSLKGKVLFTGILTDLTEQKKADKLKSEFVSTVSHELRTPLTSIKGSLGLLRSAVLGSLPEKAQSMINIAYSNSDRLVRLINDILDIEKMEAGKLTFAFQRTEIGPFLERMVEANKAYTDEFGVTLVLGDVAEGLQVETDPDRLAQVMTNLISNAAKFSPEGEIVSIGVEAFDSRIRISVTDRGAGISEAFQQQIFSKFSQADSSDTRAKGGTGLGLAITRAIIEAHGGSIAFDTEIGQGTTFYFDLPLIQTNAVDRANNGPETPKILVCEDDRDTATLLSLLIKDLGYEAEVCHSTEQAKERLASGSFAAMTLDLHMPGQDGVSFVREMRDDPSVQDLPLLVVSASPRSDQALGGSAFSLVDWLEKPIDLDRLRSSMTRAVGKFDAVGARILHIEDDNDHRLIVSALVGENAVIDHAGTCREARRYLENRDYDLVILDLMLPDSPGEALLPLIGGQDGQQPQVLVFSTKPLDNAFSLHVDKALVKSQTSNEALKRQIESQLQGVDARRDDQVAVTELKAIA